MNEVSIIINGVRYDAVDKKSISNQMFVCEDCDICNLIPNFPCNRTIGNDRVFKKSEKKFEK